jgi:hypothetical protein
VIKLETGGSEYGLPKDRKFSNRMPLSNARHVSACCSAPPVPYSAAVDPVKARLLARLKTPDILVHAALWLDSCGICSLSSNSLAACPYNPAFSFPLEQSIYAPTTSFGYSRYLVCLNLKFLPPQCPQAGQKRLLSLSSGFSSPFFAQLLDYYGERYVKKQIILPNVGGPPSNYA